ncbi:MAG: hypothetical protein JW778_02090 [Candidatus Altiarchaeota archaeon]|nr:hypothetical protein [Candidatus Altiarchaeota archaeon]
MRKTLYLIIGILITVSLANAQCGYSGTGDWIIDSKIDCKDTSITLNGNILINTGGWLNATNVFFTFNNTGKANETTRGTALEDGGNLTLVDCLYQSNEPVGGTDIEDNPGGWTNTWINVWNDVGNADCRIILNRTTFNGIGMHPLNILNSRYGIYPMEGQMWVDNCTCNKSVNCFISTADSTRGDNRTIRYLKNNKFENISTFPYVFLYDGDSETEYLEITGNTWYGNTYRMGTLDYTEKVKIYDNTASGTPNYGFSNNGASDVLIYNMNISGPPTAVELNSGNHDFEIYNLNITNGGIGCNYGNRNITIHDVDVTGKKAFVGSTAVAGSPNYNNHFYNMTYTFVFGADIVGYLIAYTGENSTIEDITIVGSPTDQTAITTKHATGGTGGSEYYVKNVTYEDISIDNINTGIRMKYFNDSTFRDIRMTNVNSYNIYFSGNNYRNRFINVTHDSVFFDNNDDVFDYYNYLSVNVTGDNVWGIEVYNRTSDLLTSGSTTTGKVEKLEVNEFKQTKVATNLQYPHTIKVTGLVADTDYNVTVNGAYSQTKKTDALGVLTFQENITDNTRMTLKATTDVYPPFITIITPQNTKYAQGALTAEISLDEDGDWCAYSLEGNPNKTMTGAGKSWTTLLTELAKIEYSIKFWCNDTQGHMGSSEKRYFTIVECLADGDCGIGQYCNTGDECKDKKGDGAPCSADKECTSNECCHSICRSVCPYCGDGYCDGGETCGTCPLDCTCAPGGGPGGGTGGSGGAIGTGGIGANCFDGIMNQGETGIDCGGPCKACPSCMDGILNQGETGVDCGGPCGECAIGATAASCYDRIKNQGEQGIDCGGPCKACKTGNILQEKFMIGLNHPSEVEAGDHYTVGVTVENTGDTTLKELNVKVGSQIKTTDLDLTEKKTVEFQLTAPREEGEYMIKVEAYNGTLREEEQTKIQVKPTPLTLRATTVDNTTYIITQTNYTDAVIELIITRENKTVYWDYISEEEHITQIQAGNYQVQANLRVDGKTLKTKQITPTTEKETIPEDMTTILAIPLLIINLALLGSITKKIIRK